MSKFRSILATFTPAKKRRRKMKTVWGVLYHTSGLGIVERAVRSHRKPIEVALEWYRGKSGVHYVIDYDGTIYQMLEDDRRGAHAGVSLTERMTFLTGRWLRKGKLSKRAIQLWRARWPGKKSPQHLYPTSSPNSCYIGVEMLPLRTPRANGLWFTEAQHDSARMLALDIGARHALPYGWMNTSRLVGHEDINAFTRWDKNGGWDPGAMRRKPRFSWRKVRVGSC